MPDRKCLDVIFNMGAWGTRHDWRQDLHFDSLMHFTLRCRRILRFLPSDLGLCLLPRVLAWHPNLVPLPSWPFSFMSFWLPQICQGFTGCNLVIRRSSAQAKPGFPDKSLCDIWLQDYCGKSLGMEWINLIHALIRAVRHSLSVGLGFWSDSFEIIMIIIGKFSHKEEFGAAKTAALAKRSLNS